MTWLRVSEALQLVQSLGTSWGLLRHYWVVIKLLITVFATILLLVHMQPVGHLARVVATTTVANGELAGHLSPLQCRMELSFGRLISVRSQASLDARTTNRPSSHGTVAGTSTFILPLVTKRRPNRGAVFLFYP